MKNYRS